MRASIEFGQLEKFNSKMGGFMSRFRPRERDLAKQAADLLLEAIKRNASGRPGPNIVTGEYRNSWKIKAGFMDVSYLIYSNAPQAARLEYGFVGTDRLGRNYNQPPFPHVRPAVLEVTPWYAAAFKRLPSEVWNS